MAFSDVLGGKLADLRRAAIDAYDDWLSGRFENDLKISDDGTRVVENQGLIYDAATTIAEEQQMYDGFLADLDSLVERFQKYSPLATTELFDVGSRLSRGGTSALGGHWATDPYSGERPRKLVDRIYHAAGIVLQISEPDDQRSEGFWRGPAADAFNDNFLDPFRKFAARQIFCGIYLANVVRIFRNATRRTQNDVIAIADACIAALRNQGGSLSDDLSDASLFLNLIAFVLPGPLDTLADVGSIALGQAAESASDRETPPEWSVDGSGSLDPFVSIYSAMEVLTSLEERLASEDDGLRADLDKDISDYFYSADFETRPERPVPPDRVEGEFLEATVETVYEYGAYYLPTAAAQYAEAKELLNECVIPDWFGELIYPRSRMEFIVARNGLRPALVWTVDYLTDAGEALVTISNDYVFHDAEIAADFEQLKADLPPPRPADYDYDASHQRPPRTELPNAG